MPPKKVPKVSRAMLEVLRAWGSRGGKKGGKARWEGVPPERRREIARKAAQARWRKSRQRTS